MKYFRNTPAVTFLIALLAGVVGWQLGHYDIKLQWNNYHPDVKIVNQTPPADKSNIDFTQFWEVWDLVSKNYYDKKAVDPQKMYYGAIQGMVAAVGDPYTVFLPPEAQKSTQEELGGSFDGVGMQLEFNKDKQLVAVAILSDTPAEKAGIKSGDLIVKINDKNAQGLSIPEAVALIRGPKGSKVTLEMYREGDMATKKLDLVRDTIVVKSVEFTQKLSPQGKKIAYLKLTRFGDRTVTEWNDAVSKALASGSQGIVLDVRDNPGGYLDGAVYIGSEFISTGNIVLEEDASGERKSHPVERVGKLLNLPLEVLINKGSASASEIVSGAIQDAGRGKLIGQQSFGKGTIQASQELENNTGLHITKAKWLTPNGRWIHNIGLTPDITVDPGTDPTKDLQLDKALQTFD